MSAGVSAGTTGRGWRDRAACRGEDPELFFPSTESGTTYREQVAAAKAVCARRPVVAECLVEAVARIPFGIAGGLTAEERRGLRRRPSAGAPDEAVEELARVGTRAEVAAAGRVLLGRGRSAREVAWRCGVSERTALRWAAACRRGAAR
jgi:hypothetical protein